VLKFERKSVAKRLITVKFKWIKISYKLIKSLLLAGYHWICATFNVRVFDLKHQETYRMHSGAYYSGAEFHVHLTS
jgi:hypothetical protein